MIYLDSCLLIYLTERHPVFYEPVSKALERNTDATLAITPLVQLECLVKPLRDANVVLQGRYESLFEHLCVLDMPERVYRQAAELRARFGLKTPDGLHLASAQHHRCEALWTNDRRLRQAAHGLDIDVTAD